MLLPYYELGHARRTYPCEEFPGKYYIYRDGEELYAFSAECGEDHARNFFRQVVEAYDDTCRYTLAWQASDNDPRIGYYTLDT